MNFPYLKIKFDNNQIFYLRYIYEYLKIDPFQYHANNFILL